MSDSRQEIAAGERKLLVDGLNGALPPGPARRKRKLRLQKVQERVERTWVSAGCFGETIQWRLAGRDG